MAAPLPTSAVIQRAAPRIASILASYATFRPRRIDASSTPCPRSTSQSTSLLSPRELEAWQGRGMSILTKRQLELSLLEIRRRERRKRQKRQKPMHQKEEGQTEHLQSDARPAKRDGLREAAILVPLCTVAGIPSILFTRRSSQLSTHASQISFPGGYYDEALDAGDSWNEKLVNAALREMHEELRYDVDELGTNGHAEIFDANMQRNNPPFITVLGSTQPVPSMTGSKVTPVIGAINYDLPHHATPQFARLFPGNPEELDWIFAVPIRELIETETAEPLERWKTNYSETGNKRDNPPMGPVFPVPEGHKKEEDDKIWGLTAIVLRPLLKRVFGPVFEDANGERSAEVAAKL